jgi:hypothetical protein
MTMRIRDMLEPDTSWIEKELRGITALPDSIPHLDQCNDFPAIYIFQNSSLDHIKPTPDLETIEKTKAYRDLVHRFAARSLEPRLIKIPWTCYTCKREPADCVPTAFRLECRRLPSNRADSPVVERDERSLLVPRTAVAAAKIVLVVLLYRFTLPPTSRNDLIQAYEAIARVPDTPPVRLQLIFTFYRCYWHNRVGRRAWDLVLDGDTVALSAEAYGVYLQDSPLVTHEPPIRATEDRHTHQGKAELWLQPLEERLAPHPPTFGRLYHHTSLTLQVINHLTGTYEPCLLYSISTHVPSLYRGWAEGPPAP